MCRGRMCPLHHVGTCHAEVGGSVFFLDGTSSGSLVLGQTLDLLQVQILETLCHRTKIVECHVAKY